MGEGSVSVVSVFETTSVPQVAVPCNQFWAHCGTEAFEENATGKKLGKEERERERERERQRERERERETERDRERERDGGSERERERDGWREREREPKI